MPIQHRPPLCPSGHFYIPTIPCTQLHLIAFCAHTMSSSFSAAYWCKGYLHLCSSMIFIFFYPWNLLTLSTSHPVVTQTHCLPIRCIGIENKCQGGKRAGRDNFDILLRSLRFLKIAIVGHMDLRTENLLGFLWASSLTAKRELCYEHFKIWPTFHQLFDLKKRCRPGTKFFFTPFAHRHILSTSQPGPARGDWIPVQTGMKRFNLQARGEGHKIVNWVRDKRRAETGDTPSSKPAAKQVVKDYHVTIHTGKLGKSADECFDQQWGNRIGSASRYLSRCVKGIHAILSVRG